MATVNRKESRQAKASRLMRDYRDARDLVNQLVGRAQTMMTGEPVKPSGPPLDETWIERWERATKRERAAEKAWRRFLQGDDAD